MYEALYASVPDADAYSASYIILPPFAAHHMISSLYTGAFLFVKRKKTFVILIIPYATKSRNLFSANETLCGFTHRKSCYILML